MVWACPKAQEWEVEGKLLFVIAVTVLRDIALEARW